jgi:hypothetical protein
LCPANHISMTELATISDEKVNADRTPRDVLHATMLFYEGKAKKLANHIMKMIKESAKADAQTAAMLYKSMVEADKLCVDAAAKLAPYVHPRLESITSKINIERMLLDNKKSASPIIEDAQEDELTPPDSPPE